MNREVIVRKLKDDHGFSPPIWWECQWRRKPCNQISCPLCGRMIKQRFKHELKGENPNTAGALAADIHDSFEEALLLLQQSANELKLDLNALSSTDFKKPPDHHNHPTFEKAQQWVSKLYHYLRSIENEWKGNDVGADLIWYANLILPKLKRNLDNRWQISRGDNFYKVDYDYQAYVLANCILITQHSLEGIITTHFRTRDKLISLYNEFISLKDDLLSI